MQEEKNKKVWEEVFKDDISKIEEEKQLKKKEEEKGQYISVFMVFLFFGLLSIAFFILGIVLSSTEEITTEEFWELCVMAIISLVISGLCFFAIIGNKPDGFSWKRNIIKNDNSPTLPPQDNANNENNKKNQ